MCSAPFPQDPLVVADPVQDPPVVADDVSFHASLMQLFHSEQVLETLYIKDTSDLLNFKLPDRNSVFVSSAPKSPV